MAVIRPEFHSSFATQFLSDLQYLRANVFYYLGKIDSWANDEFPPDEPGETVAGDIETRNNIVFMKRVNAVDVSIVIPRYNWVSGTVFSQWDHTLNMQDTNFYCVTDEFNVYKCLSNNNGVASTVKPTGTSLSPVELSDGYVWKYMYNIPTVKQQKFVSQSWIPVQRALTDAFYSKGAIEQVSVVNGGTGYTDTLQTTINVTDSSGTGAVLIPSVSRETGEITKVTIVNGGENYVNPSLTVVQSPETGTGKFNDNESAILKAIVEDGVIVNVTVEDPGVNYPSDIDTTIVVQGDGDGAQLTPVVYDGSIIDVIVEEPGLNYSFADLIVVGNGTGASLLAQLGVSDFLSDQSLVEQTAIAGAIHAIKVTNGGNNYTSSATIQITGDGTGAAAYPVIGESGSIEKIVVTSAGSGYTQATITAVDPDRPEGQGFIDLEAYPILPPIGGHGINATKELYGSTVLIYTLIKDEAEISLLEQDYRQYGLIESPLNLITNQKITSRSATVTFDILFQSVTGLQVDDVLLSNGIRYKVVGIDEFTVKLQQLSSIYKQPGTIFSQENDSSETYSVVRIISSPNVNKYSGNLLYVTNNPPLTTSEDQAFAIRTFIRF